MPSNFSNDQLSSLNPFIQAFNTNPGSVEQDTLQTAIAGLCYQHRTAEGQYSGGKTGSVKLTLDPAQTQEILSYVRGTAQNFCLKEPLTFQTKPDSTQKSGFHVPREELNDNLAELLVTCISDTLQNAFPQKCTTHPNAIAFSSKDQTIIASQYLANTQGTLNDFINTSISYLNRLDPQNPPAGLDPKIITEMQQSYRNFQLNDNQEVAFVDPPLTDHTSLPSTLKPILLSDLDHFGTLFAHQYNNDPKNASQKISANPDILKQLLRKLSFSHIIADHDVNPGNFVIRIENQALTLARIDFGMANYHFTRGRIYGISRRSFRSLFRDYRKESLSDFICRKKIGFGINSIINFFAVQSKTHKHLLAIENMFANPQGLHQELLSEIEQDNKDQHQFFAQEKTQVDIMDQFFSKIDHLPLKEKAKIVKDLTLMSMQCDRKRYFDFSSAHRLTTLGRLLAMVSLTPILFCTRILFIVPTALYSMLTRKPASNPIPISTLSLLQQRKVHQIYAKAQSSLQECNDQLKTQLQAVLVGTVINNKPDHDNSSQHTPPGRARIANPEHTPAGHLQPSEALRPDPTETAQPDATPAHPSDSTPQAAPTTKRPPGTK